MERYKYRSYREYIKCQKAGFAKKSANVWARRPNIEHIASYLAQFNPTSGICHGVRTGCEVLWFRDILGIPVIGTEIGDSPGEYITQWDFNIPNPEWTSKFSFVYSNSFDHAYDLERTLEVWADQAGHLVLETDERNEHTGAVSRKVNKTDPTGIELDELIELVRSIMGSVTVIDLPVVTYRYRKAIVGGRTNEH